ncbi:uncharacterized protein LOC143258973 [Megalopta genalis]|uniref:uncharacterized protein LOC143258973 n=1 Tax=Megalopta genalis TaxID=115081 RepID=UPI003FD29961
MHHSVTTNKFTVYNCLFAVVAASVLDRSYDGNVEPKVFSSLCYNQIWPLTAHDPLIRLIPERWRRVKTSRSRHTLSIKFCIDIRIIVEVVGLNVPKVKYIVLIRQRSH